MSTILKALKKLEQNKDDFQTGGLPSGYMGPGSPHLGPRRGRSRFFSPVFRLILLLFIVIGLGGAVLHFYRQVHTVSPPILPTVAKKEPSPKIVPPLKARTSTPSKPRVAASSDPSNTPADQIAPKKPVTPALPAAQSPRETSADSAPMKWQSLKDLTQPGKSTEGPATPYANALVPYIAPKPVQPETPPAQQPIALPARKPVAPMNRQPVTQTIQNPVAATSQSPSDLLPTQQPMVQPIQKPTVPTAPAAKPNSPQEDRYQNTAPLSDGRLKVQAIAWSPLVEDRMAVINTRIVHEGDKVDGFVVDAIRHDDVVVSENGVYYRVAFGRP